LAGTSDGALFVAMVFTVYSGLVISRFVLPAIVGRKVLRIRL